MSIVVVAVTGAAAHFGGLRVHHGHHGVVHDTLASHAKIVDIVAQTDVADHNLSPSWRRPARRVRARPAASARGGSTAPARSRHTCRCGAGWSPSPAGL